MRREEKWEGERGKRGKVGKESVICRDGDGGKQ